MLNEAGSVTADRVYPSIHRPDNSENSNVTFGLTHQKQTNKDRTTNFTKKCIHVHILMLFLWGPKLHIWVRVLIWGVRISAHFMVSASAAVVKVIPQPTYIITLEIAFQYCDLLARQRFYFVTTMLIVCSDQLIYIICHLLGKVL